MAGKVYEEGSKGLRRAARIWSGAYPLKAVGFALAEAFGVAVDAFHEHPCKEAQALPTGSSRCSREGADVQRWLIENHIDSRSTGGVSEFGR